MDADRDLEGFDELERAFDRVPELAASIVERQFGVSLQALESVMSVYPAQPARDRAKTFNTYVRGIGRFPKSSFRKDKKAGWVRKKSNAYKPGPRGGTVKRTSERMDIKFRITVRRLEEGGVEGELRNDASYSGWPLGPKDPEQNPHQVVFHAATGWVSIDTGFDQIMPDLEAGLETATEEVLKLLAEAE